MDGLDHRGRVGPELLGQERSQMLIGRQRLRRPAGHRQGRHQLGDEPFTQRMGRHQRLEFHHDVCRTTLRQQRVVAISPRVESLFVQAATGADGVRRGTGVGQGLAPPSRQRVGEPGGGLVVTSGAQCGVPRAVGDGEGMDVDIGPRHLEPVPPLVLRDHRRAAECASCAGDEGLERVGHVCRNLVGVPDGVDQLAGRHDAGRIPGQSTQQSPQPGAGHRRRGPHPGAGYAGDFERAEQTDVHVGSLADPADPERSTDGASRLGGGR